MIHKRRVLINALVSVMQVLVTSLTLFFLYGYLMVRIGKEDFGVWAVVVASTGAAGVANLGLAAGALRFVSQHLAGGDGAQVDRTIQTAVLSVAVVVGLILLIAGPVITRLLELLIEPASKVPTSLSILPYALASFWLGAIAAVLQSCIDGLHRIDLRGLIVMGAAVAYLILALILVRDGGVVGLAQAQLLQAALVVAVSWAVLKRLRPTLPLAALRWDRATFASMWRYGLGTQVISVSQVLVEPTTKALLSKLGGVGAVASFEMAYRMVLQLRNLVTTALMVLVPAIADLQVRAPRLIREVYLQSMRLLVAIGIVALPLLLAATPIVSRVWVGSLDRAFVLYAALLFVAWGVNVLASPAYFANLGTGRLRGNVVSHVAIAGTNLLLGLALGLHFGGSGVVLAYAIALAGGSLMITVRYHLDHAIPVRALVQRESVGLALAGLGGLALGALGCVLLRSRWTAIGLSAWVAAAYAACVIVPAWRHPARRQATAWIAGLRLQPRGGSDSAGA